MQAKRSPGGAGRSEGASRTLGELLSSDATSPPVSEAAWRALVGAIAAGDQGALRALYDRTHRLVYTLAVRMTGCRETAEEVTLDVFHDVWRRAASYDASGGTVVGWIMNQARSRAIDRMRFEQRQKRDPRADGAPPASAGTDPQDTIARAEEARVLRDALAGLTTDERQAIEIAYFSDATYSEVAARLDRPLGTVKTRIRSGLGKLRRALAAMRTP